jgi:hypothetical protein
MVKAQLTKQTDHMDNLDRDITTGTYTGQDWTRLRPGYWLWLVLYSTRRVWQCG